MTATTLKTLLHTNLLDETVLDRVVRALETLHHTTHDTSPSGKHWDQFAAFCMGALARCDALAGTGDGAVIDRRLFHHVSAQLETRLKTDREQAESRLFCLLCGDLRLETVHVALNGAIAIDTSDTAAAELRYGDPVADVACMVMDMLAEGEANTAHQFAQTWFAQSNDNDGYALLPLYVVCHAVVRAEIEGSRARDFKLPDKVRTEALWSARRRWMLAYSMLMPPEDQPCLVLMVGASNSKKTTLTQTLARDEKFMVVHTQTPSRQVDLQSYQEMLWQVRAGLRAGKRVMADAGFEHAKARRVFIEAAVRLAVPAVVLHCATSSSPKGWQEFKPDVISMAYTIDMTAEDPLEQARNALVLEELAVPG